MVLQGADVSFHVIYPRVLDKIKTLVKQGEYILSIHAENEMADDRLTEQDLEAAILNGRIARRKRDLIGRASILSKAQRWTGEA
jgi:hypothetical protein